MSAHCFVLGSGSWAIAMGAVLARKGIAVTLWCRRTERAAEIAERRHGFLPGVELPDGITAVTDADASERLAGSTPDLALSVIPTQHLQSVLDHTGPWIPRGIPWVSLSKGVEQGTLRLPTAILREAGVASELAVLSGPSHAEEVVREMPTAVVLGHRDPQRGRPLQALLSADTFRVYLSGDPAGVEWGGALKNITAIGAGIAVGVGFGDNSLAALVTRGAVEMARLGEALGGRRETFSGLSGIGDLMVTCFSEHSRNRRFGIRIGQGEGPAALLAESRMVVEGVPTTRAVVELSHSLGIEMPIAEELDRVLHGGKSVRECVQRLLGRALKEE